MKTIHIRMHFFEEVLGSASFNKELHDEFIASKAPDAMSREEEVEALGVGEVVEKGMTGFARDEHGHPIVWDYQFKGMLKDSVAALRKVPGTVSSKLTAYKKVIDGLIFPQPRKVVLKMPPKAVVGDCQRPLRAQTAQGERIALAHSETVPAGTTCDVNFFLYLDEHEKLIYEVLDYGMLRGFGQWRNSGKGRFMYQILDDDGKVIGGNFDASLLVS